MEQIIYIGVNNDHKYRDDIPNYIYVKKENGNIGIVQDIPLIKEVNYDLHPPSF